MRGLMQHPPALAQAGRCSRQAVPGLLRLRSNQRCYLSSSLPPSLSPPRSA